MNNLATSCRKVIYKLLRQVALLAYFCFHRYGSEYSLK